MFFDSIQIQMPSTSTMISTVASVGAFLMLIRSIANQYMPPELQDYIYSKLRAFVGSFFTQMTLVIEEFDGLEQNELFKAADIYLRTVIRRDTQILKVSLAPKHSEISVGMEKNQETIDNFNGVAYKWRMVPKKNQSKTTNSSSNQQNAASNMELRCFRLRFHKKHKDVAFNKYLRHILSEWKAVQEETKTLKIFTLNNERMGISSSNPWVSVEFHHPVTFDTLAMDPDIKKGIMDDLERFVKRKEFYRRAGKIWKRGYLLFGPPGTGKSSLVAAMANYLNFDIYDLELPDIWNNSQLRRLLISTANRSILVVEDIDRSIKSKDRHKAAIALSPYGLEKRYQVTLSGLLNMVDGLWSSCGDERIIVFTTNRKNLLDKALLRPGRMDVHIHMSYCTPCGFRMLASNYHGTKQHPLFSEVEQLIESTKVTPAEVGEQLLKNEEPDIALRGLIEFLQEKKESDEIKASETTLEPSETKATQEPNGKEVQRKEKIQ